VLIGNSGAGRKIFTGFFRRKREGGKFRFYSDELLHQKKEGSSQAGDFFPKGRKEEIDKTVSNQTTKETLSWQQFDIS